MDLAIIQNKIYEIRGERVMLDRDLAELYQVETRVLKQAVKRNMERFPENFMFELTNMEVNILEISLRSQIVTSNRGGNRYTYYAFTEQGVAMLSAVLKSPIAIQISIQIINAFVAMRRYLTSAVIATPELAELKERVRVLEQGADQTLEAVNDLSEDMRKEMDDIYMALAELSRKNLVATEQQNRNKIGFKK
jgi:DNA-binding PadR family transcriptional regulator